MDPTNERPDPAAAGGGQAEKAARKSTRGFRVDVRRAEYLQTLYPFDAVEIRECLEGEPVKKAIRLMTWALEKAPARPYFKLRDWARRNEKGFYSPELLRRDAGEVYREFLAYAEAKRAENEERTGRSSLSPAELEDAARIFYAPRTRADMARISEGTWASYHEDLAREEEDAA